MDTTTAFSPINDSDMAAYLGKDIVDNVGAGYQRIDTDEDRDGDFIDKSAEQRPRQRPRRGVDTP